MHRCFLPVPDFPTGALLRVQGEEAHHALRVLRLRPGDECELFNGLGQAALARIEQVDSHELAARVTNSLPPLPDMALFPREPTWISLCKRRWKWACNASFRW